MNTQKVLVRMLKQLMEDTSVMQSQGAGHYTCVPLAARYNRLLGQARALFPGARGLIQTFSDIPEIDPKDPADKMKAIQGIRIEINQLVTLLEADQDEAEKDKPA